MLKTRLVDLYLKKGKSVSEIAQFLGCSQNKINYWLAKHNIKKRSISDAIYNKYHRHGDPFSYRNPRNFEEAMLYGLGLGLYWGEGSKRGKGGVRLGNTDIKMIRKFINFLDVFFNVKKKQLKFGLQIFKDIDIDTALLFWSKGLNVEKSQFYKVIVSKVRGEGTYKYKSNHGVLMVYFNNVRLKKKICGLIDNI